MGRTIVHDANHPLLVTLRKRTPLFRFCTYISERYLIRQRRLNGAPAPWTSDPILQTYRFTNVKRDWDYTTQWLVANWYNRHRGHPLIGLAAAVARFVNHVPSLETITFPPERSASLWLAHIKRTLNKRRAVGHQVFTSAYMVRGGARGTSKVDTVLYEYIRPAMADLTRPKVRSADTLHQLLVQYHGWGHFMAQEVVLDLMHTDVLARVKDRTTYAYAGPGALRGLRRMYPDWTADDEQAEARERMQMLHTLLTRSTVSEARIIPVALRTALTVHDIEFNLCEFDKYERALWNESTPKAHFTPRHPA
jgi:hypothetical protein